MEILAIGNSFSADATRYLHQIARADGKTACVANLYISGCPLEKHFRNLMGDTRAYTLYYNGMNTGFSVSIKEALLNRSWDVVTLQQASGRSPKPDSYYPYIDVLADYVRKYAPKAKLIIHQTWAYEQGSAKLENAGYADHRDMFADIKKAYAMAADKISADGIIPSGEMFQYLLANGFEKVHRDTYHATHGAGRYALGLLWYRMLFGACVTDNPFCDFDEPMSEAEMSIIKKYVESLEPLAL